MVIFSQLPVSSVYGCVFSTFLGALPPRSAKNTSWIWYSQKKRYRCIRNYCKQAGFPKNYILPRLAESGSAFFLRKNFAVSENCRTFAAE